jgi:hypothetical protein
MGRLEIHKVTVVKTGTRKTTVVMIAIHLITDILTTAAQTFVRSLAQRVHLIAGYVVINLNLWRADFTKTAAQQRLLANQLVAAEHSCGIGSQSN